MPLLLTVALLGGCETLPASPVNSRQAAPSTSPFKADGEYLAYMRILAQADPSTQKTLLQQATQEHREQASPHSRLRLALALAQLPTPAGDAPKARQLFKEVLPAAQQSSPGLELMIQAEINTLSQRIAMDERLSELQLELDKAKAKIQALTTIEKTLEQPIPEIRPKTAP